MSERQRIAFLLLTVGLWMIAGLAAYAIVIAGAGGTWLQGLVALAFGLWVFLRAGGPMVNATSVWGLSGALFIGLATIFQSPEIVQYSVFPETVFLCFLFHAVTVAVAWALNLGRGTSPPTQPRDYDSTALLVGAVATFILGDVVTSVAVLAPVGVGLMYIAPMMGVLGATASRRPAPAMLIPLLLLLVTLSQWSGGGRIWILSLLLGMLLAFQYRWHGPVKWVKWLVVFSMPPALVIAGLIELFRFKGDRAVPLSIPDGFTLGSNLGSLTSPLTVTTQLMQYWSEGLLENHGFHTFIAAALFWVPRSIWAAKPEGWGRELAWFLNPDVAAVSEHSNAALLPAELLWGFGMTGVILGMPVVGLFLWWLDTHLGRLRDVRSGVRAAHLGVVAWITLAVSLLTLMWVGTFSYAVRGVAPLMGLALITPALRWFSDNRTRQRARDTRPASHSAARRSMARSR